MGSTSKLDINTIVDEELQTITIDNISSENFSDNEWFFLQYLANNSEFYFNPSSYFIKILNSHEQLIKEAISLELISFDSLVELTEKIDPCYFRALISSLESFLKDTDSYLGNDVDEVETSTIFETDILSSTEEIVLSGSDQYVE